MKWNLTRKFILLRTLCSFQEFDEDVVVYEERFHIVHVTGKSMVEERDEEAQTVIRILAQLDKKWNSLRCKVTKCAQLNTRVRLRTSEDVEKGDFEERVCDNGIIGWKIRG